MKKAEFQEKLDSTIKYWEGHFKTKDSIVKRSNMGITFTRTADHDIRVVMATELRKLGYKVEHDSPAYDGMTRWYITDREAEELTEQGIVELLEHLYEVDRDNCTMTHKSWIKELAKALTDKDYLEGLRAEYKEYLDTVKA